jgi:hypothetical protein
LTVLVALLVVGAVVGFRALFAPIDEEPTSAEPTCTRQPVGPGRRVTTQDVTVSVFNASDRSGLANETLNRLANRGFQVGDAGNAPDGTRVRVVQVWTTQEDDVAARLVARQFGRNTVVRVGDDLGVGIDVVVGEQFQRLVPAPRFLRSRGTQEVCLPNS